MVTIGLVSLTSPSTQEVVIAEAEGTELAEGYDHCVSSVQRRVSMALGRNDLYPVVLLRREVRKRTGPMRFQGFFQSEHESRLIYRCAYCGGEAAIERTKTYPEFRRDGGTLTIIGDLKLQL